MHRTAGRRYRVVELEAADTQAARRHITAQRPTPTREATALREEIARLKEETR